MIDPRHATIALLVVAGVALSAWAIYVATNDVPNRRDTISHILSQWGRRNWAIPFAAGVLCGHFWVTGVPWRDAVHPVVTGLVLTPTAAALFLAGYWLDVKPRYWPVTALGLLLTGIALGAIAWPI